MGYQGRRVRYEKIVRMGKGFVSSHPWLWLWLWLWAVSQEDFLATGKEYFRLPPAAPLKRVGYSMGYGRYEFHTFEGVACVPARRLLRCTRRDTLFGSLVIGATRAISREPARARALALTPLAFIFWRPPCRASHPGALVVVLR